MISYKDITFCNSDCINKDCPRYLSDKIIDGANKIQLPLAQADFSEQCKGYIKDE